jgi:hypothetical protein
MKRSYLFMLLLLLLSVDVISANEYLLVIERIDRQLDAIERHCTDNRCNAWSDDEVRYVASLIERAQGTLESYKQFPVYNQDAELVSRMYTMQHHLNRMETYIDASVMTRLKAHPLNEQDNSKDGEDYILTMQLANRQFRMLEHHCAVNPCDVWSDEAVHELSSLLIHMQNTLDSFKRIPENMRGTDLIEVMGAAQQHLDKTETYIGAAVWTRMKQGRLLYSKARDM